MFEYVCYWMNIQDAGRSLPGADDVAIAEQDRTADLLLMKHTCDNDIPPGQGPAYYIEHCTEIVDGIEFTVTHANGSSTKPIADGEATWTGIPLGPFTVDEDIPVQFGEPIVFCGWTAIYEGVAYDAFAQQVPSAEAARSSSRSRSPAPSTSATTSTSRAWTISPIPPRATTPSSPGSGTAPTAPSATSPTATTTSSAAR